MLSQIDSSNFTLWVYNISSFIRNISSAGDYGRKKLRECDGLVDSVLYLVKKAIEKANIDNKSVENCVCVLRNLSYRAQEIEDPNYDKKHMQQPANESRAGQIDFQFNLFKFICIRSVDLALGLSQSLHLTQLTHWSLQKGSKFIFILLLLLRLCPNPKYPRYLKCLELQTQLIH